MQIIRSSHEYAICSSSNSKSKVNILHYDVLSNVKNRITSDKGCNIKFSFSYAQNLDKFHYKKFMVSLFRRLKEYPYIANHDIDIPRSNQILIMTYGFTFKISIRLGYYTCLSHISISHFYFLVAPFSIPFLAM